MYIGLSVGIVRSLSAARFLRGDCPTFELDSPSDIKGWMVANTGHSVASMLKDASSMVEQILCRSQAWGEQLPC